MFRSMTSNVSALSGSVANGHQTLHFVSPTPSKIPYGGFSPVRLQTRLTPRPPSWAMPCSLIGRHCRYLRPGRFVRSGSYDQPAPKTSDHDCGSSGPQLPAGSSVRSDQRLLWPHLRLCQPPDGLWIIPPGCGTVPPATEGPQFTLPILPFHAAARTPVVPMIACDNAYITGAAFATFALARQPHVPRIRIKWGRVTKLQRSLNATAWKDCLPRSGQGFYYRACVGRVAPHSHVDYDSMVHCQLPLPDSLRRDGQPYGLRTKGTK